jgi:SAM-dependent MidA family methyltransferase
VTTVEQAWHRALYGADGFYRRHDPADHFHTSVAAGELLAGALVTLARRAGLRRVVDIGSGRGRLLAEMGALAPELDLVGVDVRGRPAGLPERVQWLASPGGARLAPDVSDWLDEALVVAHEWLDDVPCPVVERDDDLRWRVLEVDQGSGGLVLGGSAPDPEDLAWLERWWPVDRPAAGERAEVGRSRDDAWAALVGGSTGSLLLAVDYAHHRPDRPPHGTLIGYRDGLACPPALDGSCDVTAHVALDAVAAAGERAGAHRSVLVDQRTALRSLGVHGRLPDRALAGPDPLGYLASVSRASEAAQLLDPAGLGGFGWLLQSTRSGQGTDVLDRVGG